MTSCVHKHAGKKSSMVLFFKQESVSSVVYHGVRKRWHISMIFVVFFASPFLHVTTRIPSEN